MTVITMLGSCKSCGIQVRLYHDDDVFVCPACNSLHQLNQKTDQFQLIHTEAPLPDLNGKLKVGSSVEYENERFVISGGIFYRLSPGYSMLWCARGNNYTLWIEEEAGTVTVYRQSAVELEHDILDELTVAQYSEIDKNIPKFLVMAVNKPQIRIATGSFCSLILFNHRTAVWLENETGVVCRIALTSDYRQVVLLGKSLNDEEKNKLLGFSYASNTTAAIPANYTCPSCSSSISIYAGGQTSHVVCSSCRNIFSVENNQLIHLKGANKKHIERPVFSIGDIDKIDGVDWVVIAISEKIESGTTYRWFEYTLYHPDYARRYLSEFSGHWTFVSPTDKLPVSADRTCTYKENKYDLFLKGITQIRSFQGEYETRPDTSERINIAEYIAPPFMVGSEIVFTSISWYQGRYLTKKEVAAAFGIDKNKLPIQSGIGALQPLRQFILPSKHLIWFLLLPIALLFVLQSAITPNDSETVFSERYVLSDTLTSRTITQVTPVFYLKGDRQNLMIYLSSDLTNNWNEAFVVLTNTKTLEVNTINFGVEHYSGVDADGAWQEGSKTTDAIISGLPQGEYRAEITLSSGTIPPGGITSYIQFTRSVMTWTNFWWSVLFVSIIPIIPILRNHFFEKRRWSNSEYSS